MFSWSLLGTNQWHSWPWPFQVLLDWTYRKAYVSVIYRGGYIPKKNTVYGTGWGPQESVQLPHKWLKMVDITIVFMGLISWFINRLKHIWGGAVLFGTVELYFFREHLPKLVSLKVPYTRKYLGSSCGIKGPWLRWLGDYIKNSWDFLNRIAMA